DAVLVFSLTVNDGTESSSADAVTITVEAPSPTPATAFAEYEEEIRATLVDDARRNLTSAMSTNQRLIRDARGRMIETQQALSGCAVDETQSGVGVESELDSFECTPNSVSTRNYVPFDVDGTFALNGTTVSTSGSFFGQTGNYEGTQRRLFFGDFDVQHDSDTGSSTATLTARVAWEQMTSDRTMLGYFIGGELAHSNIDGAFEGDQDRVGVTAGGYAVYQLADQVYLDGFISYGIGRNNLDMKNDVLALTSDYTTRTATVGASLSGVYEYERYEFRPELALSYGKTWIGNVGFTGRAYGLVDDTLSLDAGNVSIANLTLRPEVVWALDADTVADSRSQLSFAPRAICERTIATTRTENCGGGAELGLSSTSEDGLSNAEIRFVLDRVGSSYRSSFAVNLEHRF
uniref:autotransporter domain-containing protein n=1 Tax=Marivivens marinus TaxID=3110173 RepID=UPI003B84A49C